MDNLKSLRSYWTSIAEYFRSKHDLELISERDLESFMTRSLSEGAAYLALYLPSLASDIYRSFKTGTLDISGRFACKGTSSLPVFLYGYFKSLYTVEGYLLELIPARQILFKELLQLLGMYKKLEGPFEGSVTSQMATEFVALQEDSPSFIDLVLLDGKFNGILTRAANILENCLKDFSNDYALKHGNGAVADGLHNAVKLARPFLGTAGGADETLNWVTPFWEAHWEHYTATKVAREETSIGTVVFVEKQFKKPRMIFETSATEMTFQQAFMNSYMKYVESHNTRMKGCVNFTDQTVNQDMARKAVSLGYATIDMKDASDRIWLTLVQYLFPSHVLRDLMRCRTEKVDLSGYNGPSDLLLKSFAAMGEAICFPVLATTLWALLQAVADEIGNSNPIFVFGDDIICDTRLVSQLLVLFKALNMKINESKSYWHSSFRESCGVDILVDTDVTTAKYRAGAATVRMARAALSAKEQRNWDLRHKRNVEIEAYLSEIGFINSITTHFGVELGEVVALAVESTYNRRLIRTVADKGIAYSVRLPDINDTNKLCLIKNKVRRNKNLQYDEVKLICPALSVDLAKDTLRGKYFKRKSPTDSQILSEFWLLENGRFQSAYRGLRPGQPRDKRALDHLTSNSSITFFSDKTKSFKKILYVEDFKDKYVESGLKAREPFFIRSRSLSDCACWVAESLICD